MSRAHLLGLTGSDDHKAVEKREALHHKRTTRQQEVAAATSHRMELWRIKHNAWVDRWKSRATAFGDLYKIANDGLENTTPAPAILFFASIAAAFIVVVTVQGILDWTVYVDPVSPSRYYVRESNLKAAGNSNAFVVKMAENERSWGGSTITDPMGVEDIHEALRKYQAMYPDKYIYTSEVSEQTDCWMVMESVRGSDRQASQCYVVFTDVQDELMRMREEEATLPASSDATDLPPPAPPAP